MTICTNEILLPVVVYSWLWFCSWLQRLLIVDPTARVLVRGIIAIIINSKTLWHAAAKVQTILKGLVLLFRIWSSSFNIGFLLNSEWNGASWKKCFTQSQSQRFYKRSLWIFLAEYILTEYSKNQWLGQPCVIHENVRISKLEFNYHDNYLHQTCMVPLHNGQQLAAPSFLIPERPHHESNSEHSCMVEDSCHNQIQDTQQFPCRDQHIQLQL